MDILEMEDANKKKHLEMFSITFASFEASWEQSLPFGMVCFQVENMRFLVNQINMTHRTGSNIRIHRPNAKKKNIRKICKAENLNFVQGEIGRPMEK